MASIERRQQGEDLNDSWIELQNSSPSQTQLTDPAALHSVYNGNLEKLLIEAQRESRTPSRPNSKESSTRGSPKSPHSPNNEWAGEWRSRQDPGTDWIWDWSSRPEVMPPGDWNGKFRHPMTKPRQHPLSVRHTNALRRAVFTLENLPTLLLTHAATFVLGAAVMFLFAKKYWNMAAISAPAVD
ncbi:BCL2/adenovirus E1B 19 kDa protein-interacting protein 3-like isoform X2 [Gigantopelta aegis]|uniref:BCL2/adenovirus E1B 19 kDa protein-interacting protein 3-like isoform X2 n=1 Tax=Gigantopelta aegis TaxID=1735272 RepID=UPI001B88AD2C|nr:BCL2/adenovirus E1B 19 kDa protein-interacting protein 3-like isoform X2 [Gigantopelta aegis]